MGKALCLNRGPRVWHFAYGANVDPETLQIRGIDLFSQNTLVLDGFAFSFTHPGPFEGQAFADLKGDPSAQTFGKLYQISKWDMLRMHMFELALIFDRHKVAWFTKEGKDIYFYQATQTRDNIRPFCAYRNKIVNAYRVANLDLPDYIERVEGHPCLVKAQRSKDLRFFKNTDRYPRWLARVIRKYDHWMACTMARIYPHPLAGQSDKKK